VGTQFDAGLGHACRSAGVEPHIVHRADDATLLQTLAGSGLGVALLAALACSAPKCPLGEPALISSRR
jgi:DNA-binding transcriptional LysR family regulator